MQPTRQKLYNRLKILHIKDLMYLWRPQTHAIEEQVLGLHQDREIEVETHEKEVVIMAVIAPEGVVAEVEHVRKEAVAIVVVEKGEAGK